MTRVTNLGRKRTYIEAGFSHNAEAEDPDRLLGNDPPASNLDKEATDPPPKKKRKRTKKPKSQVEETKQSKDLETGIAGGGDDDTQNAEKTGDEHAAQEKSKKIKSKASGKKGRDKKLKAATWRAEQSELRRQKRISERQTDTICFACREKGHAARDCPVSRLDELGDGAGSKVVQAVGICYRCGSKRHTLSRCKNTVDPSDPLPFASCFVCSGKGHLASSCPQNKARGIYPNGGSCKLCGDTTHLAKNCGLRKHESNGTNDSMLFGHADEGKIGADEDDFHEFKRRTAQIDKDEKTEERSKKALDLKAGVHSGIVKAFGKPQNVSTKRVVYFK